jgi:hypothetical protein|tara:strand:+ start:49 stop:618 length:570 start_codon:yes stop_codon:yes gene_type:complete
MAQAKMYQVDYLSSKISNSFEDFEKVLDQKVRMEEAEFIRDKKEELSKKLGADKIKKALKEAEERYEQAQEQAKEFLRTFANKHKLQETIKDYRYMDRKFKVSDIDDQVDDFARKYANTFVKKTRAMKDRQKIRELKSICYDAIKLTNDIEQAQAKVETILKTKAPFILEQYAPNINLLEAPKREEEQL